MVGIMPLFIGGMPGGMELAVILLVLILLFGANKIPKLARSTGEAMGEFKKGREEVDKELREMREGTTSSSSSDVSSENTGSTASETAGTNDAAAETEAETNKQ